MYILSNVTARANNELLKLKLVFNKQKNSIPEPTCCSAINDVFIFWISSFFCCSISSIWDLSRSSSAESSDRGAPPPADSSACSDSPPSLKKHKKNKY